MKEFERIIEDYIKWIKDNTHLRAIDGNKHIEISTPFLDRHNDNLEIYAYKEGPNIVLTDGGYTIQDLRMSGMELTSPKRQQIFQTVLNGFGVKVGEDDALMIEANSSNIGQKKHYFIQAILAVNDLYSLSQESVYSFFKEDIERFFGLNEIYYTKDIKISGRTGFDHNMDFVISASRNKPERLIKSLNHAKKDTVTPLLFAFADIQAIRPNETKNIIIYNDTEKERPVPGEVLSAMQNYGVIGIPWSQRESRVAEFQLI
jgi:hypothetical protein